MRDLLRRLTQRIALDTSPRYSDEFIAIRNVNKRVAASLGVSLQDAENVNEYGFTTKKGHRDHTYIVVGRLPLTWFEHLVFVAWCLWYHTRVDNPKFYRDCLKRHVVAEGIPVSDEEIDKMFESNDDE